MASVGAPPLQTLLRALRRRALLLLLPMVIVPAVALYRSSSQRAVFEATSDVLLSPDNVAAIATGVSVGPSSPGREAQTQAQIAHVEAVARRALELASVRDRTARALLAATSVEPDPSTDILRFVVRDRRGDVAVRMSGAFARAYVEHRVAMDGAAIGQARADVQREIERLVAAGRGTTSLADDLRNKDQQLAIVSTLQSARASVLRLAVEARQVEPQPRSALILGAILGLIVGAALVLGAEAMDTRVRSAGSVADLLRLPLLGRLPGPSRSARHGPLVMLGEPRSPHGEAFRTLRTNLELVAPQESFRSLLIVGAHQGEGKSTTAANLALSFAQLGRSVVALDLDVRRPSLATLFGVNDSPGVSGVVLHMSTLDDALVDVPSLPGADDRRGAGLSVLPAGRVPQDAALLLSLPGIGELIRNCCARADRVIIDTAPMLSVADALTLSTHVDGILVVSSGRDASTAALAEFRRVLDAAPAPVVGVVVTGADDALRGYPSEYGVTDRTGRARPSHRSRRRSMRVRTGRPFRG
jgi:succinoglycan biosynthesis transport protein ExoP